MLENGCVLYDEQCRFIYKVSFLSLFSSLYAPYRGHYDLALAPGGVFLTSINYWKKPDYSWRRYVDMAYVKMAISYQMYRAYNADNARLYYVILFFSVCCYEIGSRYYKKNCIGNRHMHTVCCIYLQTCQILFYMREKFRVFKLKNLIII